MLSYKQSFNKTGIWSLESKNDLKLFLNRILMSDLLSFCFTIKSFLLKDILKEKSFDMSADTTFEAFATVVCEDKRSSTLDAGNVKLTYNALLEKAESKEKERLKEEARKLKKLEASLKVVLGDFQINAETK